MITSVHNPRIQWVRALLGRPRARAEAGVFIVEGVRMAEEVLESGRKPVLSLYAGSLTARGLAVTAALREAGGEVLEVSREILDALSDTENSQGILIALPVFSLPPPASLHFGVILDNLRDPGNLGTILRTCAAAGVQRAWLTPGCADPLAPKVVRAAMGAHFHLPIAEAGWDTLQAELKHGAPAPRVWVTDIEVGQPYWQADLRGPTVLVIGSEASGVSAEARALAGGRIHIPMPGRAESLNAAAAAAILLFETVRQRSPQKTGPS